ncbi:hypothetical protein CEXT_67731 [Caerostris extrusa]|uniref:AraC family transcriptional regulator n=1 Tax=Caerostris extrusa TaxID=172846 RepID=A0AAV4SNC8_CAEEX|nr:hypothetical protein CEXT_67731 [Caerostris extrusa]
MAGVLRLSSRRIKTVNPDHLRTSLISATEKTCSTFFEEGTIVKREWPAHSLDLITVGYKYEVLGRRIPAHSHMGLELLYLIIGH